jgi:hypothetical protein
MKEILTQEKLTEHFNQWMKNVGPHRNEQDIRFGQYIWNRYNQQLSEAKAKISEMDRILDGFYPEYPETAYKQILKLIL